MNERQERAVWAFGWAVFSYLAGQIMTEFMISGTRLRWTFERYW